MWICLLEGHRAILLEMADCSIIATPTEPTVKSWRDGYLRYLLPTMLKQKRCHTTCLCDDQEGRLRLLDNILEHYLYLQHENLPSGIYIALLVCNNEEEMALGRKLIQQLAVLYQKRQIPYPVRVNIQIPGNALSMVNSGLTREARLVLHLITNPMPLMLKLRPFHGVYALSVPEEYALCWTSGERLVNDSDTS